MLTADELAQLATHRRPATPMLCPNCAAHPTSAHGICEPCRKARARDLARARKRRWWAAHGADWRAARRARAA